ncbi:TPA: hypothetical protein ACGUMG_003178 [Vibrio vulnificus]
MVAWNKGKQVGQKKAFKLQDNGRTHIHPEAKYHQFHNITAPR